MAQFKQFHCWHEKESGFNGNGTQDLCVAGSVRLCSLSFPPIDVLLIIEARSVCDVSKSEIETKQLSSRTKLGRTVRQYLGKHQDSEKNWAIAFWFSLILIS